MSKYREILSKMVQGVSLRCLWTISTELFETFKKLFFNMLITIWQEKLGHRAQFWVIQCRYCNYRESAKKLSPAALTSPGVLWFCVVFERNKYLNCFHINCDIDHESGYVTIFLIPQEKMSGMTSMYLMLAFPWRACDIPHWSTLFRGHVILQYQCSERNIVLIVCTWCHHFLKFKTKEPQCY